MMDRRASLAMTGIRTLAITGLKLLATTSFLSAYSVNVNPPISAPGEREPPRARWK